MLAVAPPDPFALPAFILSIVSLAVAVLGAITGIVALAWQITTRTRGAHRIVIDTNPNMMLVGAGGIAPPGPYVEVNVRNRGAAAVQVQQWSILLPDGEKALVVIPALFPPSPDLPFTLEAGSATSFHVLRSELEKSATAQELSESRIRVHLATGQKVTGRKPVIPLGE